MTWLDVVNAVGIILFTLWCWPLMDQQRCPRCLGKRRRCEPCGGWECTRCGTHQERRP
jgi:hypothetical protein